MGNEEYKETFEAIVEINETYIGGKPRKGNKHGRGTNKTPVVGVTERSSGKVHAVVALPKKDEKKLRGKRLLSVLDSVCKKGTTVMTDQLFKLRHIGWKDG